VDQIAPYLTPNGVLEVNAAAARREADIQRARAEAAEARVAELENPDE
jgi:hypothetical protein